MITNVSYNYSRTKLSEVISYFIISVADVSDILVGLSVVGNKEYEQSTINKLIILTVRFNI